MIGVKQKLKEEFNLFLDSFKQIEPSHIFIILYDLLAIGGVVLLFALYATLLKAATWTIPYIVFYTILFIASSVALWHFFKCMIYARLTNIKVTPKYYLNFMFLSILLFLAYSVFIGIIAVIKFLVFGKGYIPSGLIPKFIFFFVPLLILVFALYLLINTMILLSKEKGIKKTLNKLNKVYIKKHRHFSLHIAFALVVFMILDFVARIVQSFIDNSNILIFLVLIPVYFLWLRIYFIEVARK